MVGQRLRAAVVLLACSLGHIACSSLGDVELTPEDEGLLGGGAPLATNHFVRIPAAAFPPKATVQQKLRRLLSGASKAAAAPAPTCTGIVKVYMNGNPFHGPSAVDWDSRGNLWVANDVSNSIMKIERSGGALVFGTKGSSAGVFKRPLGIAINSHDVVYVTNIMSNSVVRIYPNGQVEQVVKGKPLAGPLGIQIDSQNNIYIANAEDNKILKIKYPRGPISLLASSKDHPQVAGPQGLGMDSKDNLFVCNGLNNILKITPKGKISEFAHGGVLKSPRAIAVDSKDNIFVTNTIGAKIFKAGPNETLSTFAVAPANLKARNLWGLQVNIQDDLFVADWNNNDLLSVQPPGPPSAPTIGTAKLVHAGTDIHAVVSFTPPVHDGGCKIKKYTATSFPGDKKGTCLFSPCTIKGLKPGTQYYFFVLAHNHAGPGPSSSLSNSIQATLPPTPAPTATPKPTPSPTAAAVSPAASQTALASAAGTSAAPGAAAQAAPASAPADSGGLSTTMIGILVCIFVAPLAIVPAVNSLKGASGNSGAAVNSEESVLLRKPRAVANQDTSI